MFRAKGWDGVVDIATRYGVEGPEIESRWGTRFSAPVQTGIGASCTTGTGCFPEVNWPGRGFEDSPHLVTRLKKV